MRIPPFSERPDAAPVVSGSTLEAKAGNEECGIRA
jgi:hypothetical protein